MGLPDENTGLPKRRSRLGLTSKRKDIHKEASLASENIKTSLESTTTHETLIAPQDTVEEGKNSAAEEMFYAENRDSLVAPVSSLYNLGNTCFLNCMLHVLRYTPGFVERLAELSKNIVTEETRAGGKGPQSRKESERPVWKLVLCLDNLFYQMRRKESDYKDLCPTDAAMMAIRPDCLLDQIRHLNPLFEGNYQHDAQELLRCLLGCLDDAEMELEKEQTQRKVKEETASGHLSIEKGSTGKGRKRIFSSAKMSKKENDSVLSVLKRERVHALSSSLEEEGEDMYDEIKRKHLLKKSPGDKGDGIIQQKDLNSERLQAVSPSLISIAEEKEEDMYDEIKKKHFKKSPGNNGDGSIQQIGYEDSITAIQDESLMDEDKRSASRIGCSGDSINNKCSPETTKNPSSQLTRKSMKRGIRWHLSRLDNGDKDGENSTTVSNELSVLSKSREAVDENTVICISDEEEEENVLMLPSSSQSSLYCDSKPSSCDDITLLEEEPIFSSSDKTTSCPPNEKLSDGEKTPEQKLSTVSDDGRAQLIVLTPGKELTVHSPDKKGKGSHSPKLPSSKSFLSRIQGFLPSSAKKFLNFSSDETVLLPEIIESKSTTVQNSNDLEVGTSEESQSEKVHLANDSEFEIVERQMCEAKLKLKRCDWLGVSPVRSISASLVLEQLKNEPGVDPVPVPVRRKRKSDSLDERNGGGKKCKLTMTDKDDKSSDEDQTLLELVKIKETDKVEGKRLKKRSMVEHTFHDDGMTSTNAKMTNITNDSKNFKQLKKYRGCQLKPLSINLKKLDWLAGSDKKSFNVQEILRQGDGGPSTQRKRHVRRKQQMTSGNVCHTRTGLDGSSKGCTNAQNETREKLVQGFFGGTMSHRTCCCECEVTSDRPEKFLDISIPVRPRSSQHQTSGSSDEDEQRNDTDNCVYKLLKSFSSRERLCNENKYFCDHCYHLVEAEHFCVFQDLPKVLTIHLKRFDAGLGSFMGQVSKISDHVSVPASLPCLMVKCSHNVCWQHRYSVYAVVTHSGSSILRGHYRSYVKVTSSFNQQIAFYLKGSESHHDVLSQSAPSASPNMEDPHPISINSTDSLIGATIDDITGNDKLLCSNNQQLQSATEKQFESHTTDQASLRCSRPDQTEEKSWWLECDDEFIRIFEESEFLERLSGENGSLLGTPYVLFYHQN